VVVEGRVQGVFYRVSCAHEARAAGLAGRVRNLPDGRVEAVFEGDPRAVDALVTWCRSGPPHARVDALHVLDGVPEGLTGFAIDG
jgi:acylphosphatase